MLFGSTMSVSLIAKFPKFVVFRASSLSERDESKLLPFSESRKDLK